MKKSSLLRVLCILVTSVFLICTPESSFAAGGHGGGGGGFHGGGFGGGFHGGGGGGFHGGGFGGYHGGWGGAGLHGGWGGYGWHGGWGGYGGRGWGYPGWERGWGWGVGVGFGWGWGWGSYWAGYPYGYGYPNYYYPSYPYYPYYGPNAYAPADPDRYNGGNRDPRDNSQQQNSSYPRRETSPGVNDKIATMTLTSHKKAEDTGSAKYWLSNYQQRTVPRQEVRNVIQALLAMPPEARRRQIESGRYRNFSPKEQELLNQVAQVPPRAEPQKNADGTKPAALRLASRQVQ